MLDIPSATRCADRRFAVSSKAHSQGLVLERPSQGPREKRARHGRKPERHTKVRAAFHSELLNKYETDRVHEGTDVALVTSTRSLQIVSTGYRARAEALGSQLLENT